MINSNLLDYTQESKSQCPVCDGEIVGTRSEILRHSEKPYDNPLPNGFVYFNPSLHFCNTIVDIGGIETGIDSREELTHTHNQIVVTYDTSKGKFLELPRIRNSYQLKSLFRRNKLRTLNLNELSIFKRTITNYLADENNKEFCSWGWLSKLGLEKLFSDIPSY